MPLSFIKKATGGATAGAEEPKTSKSNKAFLDVRGVQDSRRPTARQKAAGKLPGFFKLPGRLQKQPSNTLTSQGGSGQGRSRSKLWRLLDARRRRPHDHLFSTVNSTPKACSTCSMWNEHRLKVAGDWQNFVRRR